MMTFKELVREGFAIILSLMLFPIFAVLWLFSFLFESDEEAAASSYEKVYR